MKLTAPPSPSIGRRSGPGSARLLSGLRAPNAGGDARATTPWSAWLGSALLALSLLLANLPARANVYATNLRLNGGFTNVTIAPGGSVNLSYILNEPATAGVTIEVLCGSAVVRTISVTSPNPGTTRGTNTLVWNGKDNSNNNLLAGTYSLRVTAAATGYTNWTQISNDSDPGNYVYQPTGLAVNKNPASRYYGRVFVANSGSGGSTGKLGDQVGILKLNADGSFAGEGGFSTGSYAWAGDAFSPWKMEVSADDKLYVNDWTGNGIVLAFDQLVTSNNYLTVLRGDIGPSSSSADNNPTGAAVLSGPAITGAGTGTQIWMADINQAGADGSGITRWGVTSNLICALNDLGTSIVPLSSDLNLYPYNVAVDNNNFIYTIQFVTVTNDPSPRVLRYAPYSGAPETTANWKVGMNDNDRRGAVGLAVDPTATYVAVSFRAPFPSAADGSGGLVILRALDGSLVKRDVAPLHDTPVVAWDNAGNVYAGDNAASFWRIYSPPGTNQASTVAVPAVQVSGTPTRPVLSAPTRSGGQFQFTLSGQANVCYLIQASARPGPPWTTVATNLSASAVRTITVSASGSQSFYQAVVGP